MLWYKIRKKILKPPLFLTNLRKFIFSYKIIRSNLSIIFLYEIIYQNKSLEYLEISLKNIEDYSIENFKKLILTISNLKNLNSLIITNFLNFEETKTINDSLINNTLKYLNLHHEYNFNFNLCFKNCPNLEKISFTIEEKSIKKYKFTYPLYSNFETIALFIYELNDDVSHFIINNKKFLKKLCLWNVQSTTRNFRNKTSDK
jgi:hypothetical protein